MKPTLIYCYDAYCGWCYGFSPVIRKIEMEFRNQVQFEVLSGGMVITDPPLHIGATASYILSAYPRVEKMTDVQFSDDYLWHLRNPEESDWYPDSTKPAIALCIFKEMFPDLQVQFASGLQQAMFVEGRDLTDNEAYRNILEKYSIDPEAFFVKLNDPAYEEQAQYEFALCKQLKVSGFPTAFLQVSDTKFFLLTQGFTPYDNFKSTLEKVLADVEQA
jgi:putative protein-disulfide isomerase